MKEGSIVKLDYDMWVHDEETDEYSLYETTSEQVAKDNDIHDEHKDYSTITAIVGKGTVLKGMDDSLKEAEVDKEVELMIPPEDAYGERRDENRQDEPHWARGRHPDRAVVVVVQRT